MHRRLFMKGGALAMAGTGLSPRWLARALAASPGGSRKVLVAIFLRGAADGLNMVIPHGDRDYYSLRPAIAIPQRDLLDLDGFFGLHPAMAPLRKFFDAKQLAAIHAAGSPDPTRSHFDAQDYMESGTPGRKSTADGWLNRTLMPNGASPVRAVALSPNLPRSLRGPQPALAVAALPQFKLQNSDSGGLFEQLYGKDRNLSSTARDTFAAIRLLESLPAKPVPPGVSYPETPLGRSLRQISQLIKSDVGLEVAFADSGGWDTHANQVGARPAEGQLANLTGQFARSLAAFADDLGNHLEKVVVVTMSEFGRTARENGNRGTDHGHANVMFALGGAVRGGKVYGKWPGLAPESLYQGRDLAVTTDFRDVLGEVVLGHLGVRQIAHVFPGYRVQAPGLLTSA